MMAFDWWARLTNGEVGYKVGIGEVSLVCYVISADLRQGVYNEVFRIKHFKYYQWVWLSNT